MCFVVIANMARVCFQTATGKNIIYIFITLFDIINFIFDICIGVCVFLIDVHYASSQHKLRVKIKGKWGFSRTRLELVRT